MAATQEDLASLVLSIRADLSKVLPDLAKLAQAGAKAAKETEDSFKKSADNINRSLSKVGTDGTRSLRATRAEAANMSSQFQDIFVQLQGGGSPFTVATQQGTQLASVLQNIAAQGGGVGAMFKGLGAAALSFVNPIQIGTIIVIAMIGYLVKFAATAVGATKTADDVWKKHQQTISDVKDAYGDLVKGIESVRPGASIARLSAQMEASIKDQTGVLQRAQQDFMNSVGDAFSGSGLRKAFGTGSAFRNSPVFSALKDFTEQMKEFKAGTTDAAPSADELIANLTKIAETLDGPTKTALDDFIKKLSAQSDAGDKASRVLTEMQGQYALLRAAADGTTESQLKFNKALEDMGNVAKEQLSSVDQLIQKYRDAIAASQGMEDRIAAQKQLQEGLVRVQNEAIKNIGTETGGDFQKILEAAEGTGQNPKSTARGKFQFIDSTFAEQVRKLGLGIGETDAQLQRFRNDTDVVNRVFQNFTEENAAKLRKMGIEVNNVTKYMAHFLGPGGSGIAGKGGAIELMQAPEGQSLISVIGQDAIEANQPLLNFNMTVGDAKKAIEAYWNARARQVAPTSFEEATAQVEAHTKSIMDQAREAGQLAEAFDKVAAAKEKARVVDLLTEAARKENKEITPEVAAEIERVATAAGNAAGAIKGYSDEQKNNAVWAKAMADANMKGVEATDAQRDAAIRAKQAMANTFAQLGTQFVTGFISDLKAGKSATEALTDALSNLADQLLNMVVSGLFQQLGNALFGVPGTGLQSFPGTNFHSGGRVGMGGGSRRPGKLSPFAFMGAPRMAGGGFIGVGPGEYPAILHRGEVVVPASMVRQAMRMPASSAGNGGGNTRISIGNIGITTNLSPNGLSTGDVKADSERGKQMGRQLSAMVQAEIAKQSRPGGLLTAVGSAGRVGR